MKKATRFIAVFILFALLAGCAPATPAAPSATPVLTPPSFADLIPIAQAFVKDLSSQNFESAFSRFDANYKTAMTLPTLKSTWQQLLSLSGAFQNQVAVKTSFVQGKPVVAVTCDFDNGTMDIMVAFNNNSQIIGMYFTQMQTGLPAPSRF